MLEQLHWLSKAALCAVLGCAVLHGWQLRAAELVQHTAAAVVLPCNSNC